ncbi:hypothetical protein HOD29_01345 [archaeon]|jgi:hypothetical protein|nr:hypothetical protein [archaeon]
MKFLKNKKGEMTTQQIVLLIILIASFAVILGFLFKLNFGAESEKDICHNSVVLRGKAFLGGGAVPLDCEKSYVCISKDKKCEKMVNPNLVRVETKEDVYLALANELADCWWMFGEGKVNYVGKDTFPELYCSICSQVAFDDSVKQIFSANDFDKREFYKYLTLKKLTSQDKTYAEYLFGTNNLDDIYNGSFGQVSLDKQHYILIGTTSEVTTIGWIGIGAVTVVGGALTAGGGWIAGGVAAIIGGTAGNFIAPLIEGLSGQRFIPPSLIDINDDFDDLECKNIVTLS